MSSFDRTNTYEFWINGKKIVLKPTSKSGTRNQRIEIITDRESKQSLHLVSRVQFLMKSKQEGIVHVIIAVGSLLVHM